VNISAMAIGDGFIGRLIACVLCSYAPRHRRRLPQTARRNMVSRTFRQTKKTNLPAPESSGILICRVSAEAGVEVGRVL
jgi:hypothetical protein